MQMPMPTGNRQCSNNNAVSEEREQQVLGALARTARLSVTPQPENFVWPVIQPTPFIEPALTVQDVLHSSMADSTRATYKGYQKKIVDYFAHQHPSLVTDEKLHLAEISPTLYQNFFLSRTGTNGRILGIASLRGYKSALMDLYRQQELDPSADVVRALRRLFQGFKRMDAKDRLLGRRVSAGKKPLNYAFYRRIAVEMQKSMHKDSGFSHLFLLLSWNLMCRSKSTAMLRFEHFIYKGDCFGVFIPMQKNDQDGSRPQDPKHIFCNPFDPAVCPLLSLAVYLASNPLSSDALFPGSSQKARFNKHLQETMRKLESLLGKSFGTHSIRKGAGTSLLCVFFPSCDIVVYFLSLCLPLL